MRRPFAVGKLNAVELRISRVGSVEASQATVAGPRPKLSADSHEITVLPVPGWCCRAVCVCGWASLTMDRDDAEWMGLRHLHDVGRRKVQ